MWLITKRSVRHIITSYPSLSPTFCLSLSLAPFSFSAMTLLPTLQTKRTQWEANFLDPRHAANSHIFSLPIWYHRETIHNCLMHGSHPSHWHPHREFSPLSNIMNYLLEICYLEKKLWPNFSFSCSPISSLFFMVKLLKKKSCLYSEYPLHILPFSLKSTLIRVSLLPLHQSCSYHNHHWSSLNWNQWPVLSLWLTWLSAIFSLDNHSCLLDKLS